MDEAAPIDDAPPAEPRVSVLVTTFRAPPELLRACLQSVFAQTEPDFELVLVLDGEPTRDDLCVIEEFGADPRLRVLEPGRVGRGRALNLGIRASRAAVVAIQDADDESHRERLTRQLEVLDERPDIDLLATAVRQTRQLGEHADWPLVGPGGHVRPIGRELLVRNPLGHSSVMIRRATLDRVAGYSVGRHRHFDYDLYLRVRRGGGKIASLEQPLVLKRIHDRQVFERDAIILKRVWTTYRLQMAHARDERGLERLSTCAVVTARQGGHLVRALARRRRRPLGVPAR